jgi:hypothetical protein
LPLAQEGAITISIAAAMQLDCSLLEVALLLLLLLREDAAAEADHPVISVPCPVFQTTFTGVISWQHLLLATVE